MNGMHENASLYVAKRQYRHSSGPYECLWKHWWVKSLKHKVFIPRNKCELEVLNCGEDVFGRIEKDVENARRTVDIITWGFDPGMVLTRNGSSGNGMRYGEILKRIATREKDPVLVRILVWHDDVFAHLKMKNIPSYYGGRFPTIGVCAGYLSDEHEKYNTKWFSEILQGEYPNIRFHVREVALEHRKEALSTENYDIGISGWLGSLYPTHHQKMMLIDYELPSRAVGYVMGHNSITDFWDTAAHVFRDPRRETFYKRNPKEMTKDMASWIDEVGYYLHGGVFMGEKPYSSRQQQRLSEFMEVNALTAKPYQDVSVRVRGPILYDLNFNFCEGWSESEFIKSRIRHAVAIVENALPPLVRTLVKSLPDSRRHGTKLERHVYPDPDPGFIKRRARLDASAFSIEWGKHSAQLLRTQPMHKEKGIKECYANLTRQVENYIFLQNQYIQYEEWTAYLKECAARLREAGYVKPINVFILTSTPESDGMDIPTYAVAKEIGQSGTMVYEHEEAKKLAKQGKAPLPLGPAELSRFGINVVMGSMWTCAPKPRSPDDYEEVYIHAKVAIVDDVAFTIGSANLNVRSMALDSELNILSQAMDVALDLRRKLFLQCTNNEGPAAFADMSGSLQEWQDIAENNLAAMRDGLPLTCQLVAFHVNRKPSAPVM